MTALGIFGILLGLIAARFAFVHPDRLRVSVFAIAYFLHISMALLYYVYVQTESADTALYYYDPMDYYNTRGLGVSTDLIIFIVQSIKTNFGGTYLDFFMLFQAFGFWAIALLLRMIEEITSEFQVPQPLYTYALFLLPSLHWWSSAIGKDAPFLLAIVVLLWGTLRIRPRLLWIGLALTLLLVIRAHIALLILAALFVTVLGERRIALWLRGVLAILAVLGIGLAMTAVQSTLNLDLTNPETLTFALEIRDNVLNSDDAGQSRVDSAYALRMISLLFRPFFIDVENAFGWVTSFENALLLFIFTAFIFRIRSLWTLVRGSSFVRFAVIASILIIAFQSLAYYNIGLGLRQKWTMICPFLLMIFVTLVLFRRARALADSDPGASASVGPGLEHPAAYRLRALG